MAWPPAPPCGDAPPAAGSCAAPEAGGRTRRAECSLRDLHLRGKHLTPCPRGYNSKACCHGLSGGFRKMEPQTPTVMHRSPSHSSSSPLPGHASWDHIPSTRLTPKYLSQGWFGGNLLWIELCPQKRCVEVSTPMTSE